MGLWVSKIFLMTGIITMIKLCSSNCIKIWPNKINVFNMKRLRSFNSFNSLNIDLQDWWREKNFVVLKIQFLILKLMILFSDAPHTVDTFYMIIIMFQAPFVSTVSPSVWKMWTSHSVCRNAKLRKFQHGHSSVCSAPGERLQAFLDQRFRSRWSGTFYFVYL